MVQKNNDKDNSNLQNWSDIKCSLRLFKTGNIDALVIPNKKLLKVFTEASADKPYRVLIEKMHESAVTLDNNNTIIYCNVSFARLVEIPLQKVIGMLFTFFISDPFKSEGKTMLEKGRVKFIKREISLISFAGKEIPVLISLNSFLLESIPVLTMIITDLTIQNKNQEALKLKTAELKKKNLELIKANNELSYQNKQKVKKETQLINLSDNLNVQQNLLKQANTILRKQAVLLQQHRKEVILANNNLLKLNRHLETRVLERTLQLQNKNEELKQLNVAKDKLLSVISHDLRNPLSALLMASDALCAKTESDPGFDIQPFVKIISRTAERILQQLNELLERAQAEHAKNIFNPERINLSVQIDKSLALLKEIAVQKNITLKNKVPNGIFIKGDVIMLQSIIQNLVTNSIKYTPGGGFITIDTTIKDNMVEVSVVDSGTGMSDDTRLKLFTTSYSVSILGTANEKGSGIGLMLVKDFIMQHGGTIKVKSKKGEGTKMIFTLKKY